MQDLIKTIRKKMNLSQEQLAALIGISPVTVNRWENEKEKLNTCIFIVSMNC